jgi:hypothetical protein
LDVTVEKVPGRWVDCLDRLQDTPYCKGPTTGLSEGSMILQLLTTPVHKLPEMFLLATTEGEEEEGVLEGK